MQQQRLTERLTSFWENLRKAELMPDFSRFNAATIDDLWQQCVVFAIQPSAPGQPPLIKFQRVGDKLLKFYGKDMTGQIFSGSVKATMGAANPRRIGEVIETPQLLIEDGQFLNGQQKMIKYRSCLLPFGREGKVTHIIAGLSWREF